MNPRADSASTNNSEAGLHAFCRPGLIVHLLFPAARRERGVTEQLVEYAAASPFYKAVEIAEVEDRSERRAIRAIAHAAELRIVYWLSLLQLDCVDSISSIDEVARRRAVAALSRQLPFAAECGAYAVGIVSGRDVGDEDRPRAVASLRQSILELSIEARALGLGRLEMETMDRDAHKKQVLGPTREAVSFIDELRALGVDLQLVFDTAHIQLLGEEIEDSITKAASVTGHIHLANCVSDPMHPLFGDNHMPLGAPGFLDAACIGSFLKLARGQGVLGKHLPIMSVEVAANGGDRAWQLEEHSREMMLELSHC